MSIDNAITIYYHEQEERYYVKVKFAGATDNYKAEVDEEGKHVSILVDNNGSKEFEVPLNLARYGDTVVIRGWLPYPELQRPVGAQPATKGKVTIKFEEDDEAVLNPGGKGGKR